MLTLRGIYVILLENLHPDSPECAGFLIPSTLCDYAISRDIQCPLPILNS